MAPRRPPIAVGETASETAASTEPSYNLRRPVWTHCNPMKHNIFGLALLTLLAAVAPSAEQGTGAPPQPADPTGQPGVTFRAESQLRRSGCARRRCAGQLRLDARARRFSGARGRQAATDHRVLAGQPAGRARRCGPLFANQPIEPDVQTNASGFNGRVYLIVLDDMHTAPLRSARVKAAAKQFVQRYLGRQRRRRHRPHQRPHRRRAGVHQQPAAAGQRDRQVHGAQAALGDAPAHRGRVADARHARRQRAHQRSRRGRARHTTRATRSTR